MKQKLIIVAIVVMTALTVLYGAGTTINGARIISGVLTVANGAVLGTPASLNLTNATALPCGALPALTGAISSAGGTCTTTGGGSNFPFTFVQDTTAVAPSNVNSFTITFPQTAAASGNTLWMIVATDGSASVGLPSGWTADINQTQATFARLIVLHKTSASDTSATFTLTASSIAVYFFELVGSRSLDAMSTGGVANTNQIQPPAITPTAGSLVIAALCAVAGASTGPGAFWQSPTINSANWGPPLNIGATTGGGRALFGWVGQHAAANVSTQPPAINILGAFTAGGGIAYATFSIL